MFRTRLLAAIAAALIPGAVAAQDGAQVVLGFGASVSPVYFGSDDYSAGPTGSISLQYVKLGNMSFGSPDVGSRSQGFSLGGSFRMVGSRKAEDHPELTGLDDIDRSVELGLSMTYNGPGYRAFAKLRYGVIGHESLVGEIGADAVVRPNDRLTLTAGPRFQFGSDRFTSTYFGVTADEAFLSGLPEYNADGGLLSAGVQIGMNYQFNDDWGMRGAIGYSRLMGDAGDSPITGMGSRTQGSASLMLTRRVSFGF